MCPVCNIIVLMVTLCRIIFVDKSSTYSFRFEYFWLELISYLAIYGLNFFKTTIFYVIASLCRRRAMSITIDPSKSDILSVILKDKRTICNYAGIMWHLHWCALWKANANHLCANLPLGDTLAADNKNISGNALTFVFRLTCALSHKVCIDA